VNQLTKLGTYRRTNGYDGAAVAQFQPINQRFGGYHQIICLPVFPNNKEVTRSWVAVRAIFVYPLPPTVVKRQFRLGAVLTETAAEGFLLASVQSDDTPLFVTLNSVAMTRPMHRHIARGSHKKAPCLRTRRGL